LQWHFGIAENIFGIYHATMGTKKKGRGRPPKGSGEAYSESLLLKLMPAEKQAFQDAANMAGLPLVGWIRQCCRKSATRELQQAGRDVPFHK
jgi:hypothetical protein